MWSVVELDHSSESSDSIDSIDFVDLSVSTAASDIVSNDRTDCVLNISTLPDSVIVNLLSFNVRGFKSNVDYIKRLISIYNNSHPLVLCISEHWLYSYDSVLLKEFTGFKYVLNSVKDDPLYLPKSIRGKGGVALLWSDALSDHVSHFSFPSDDRIVGIRICCSPCDIILFSVYLPCRSGCTDNFKLVLDQLDSTFDLFPNVIILFAGDFNADLGFGHAHPVNEQGAILHRYLSKWDYVSSHLVLASSGNVFTYESEAHGSQSIIDHILCPRFFADYLCTSHVLSEYPLNMSDHLPLFAQFRICPPVVSPPPLSSQMDANHVTPRWDRCPSEFLFNYSTLLKSSLPTCPISWSTDTIDSFVNCITSSLLSAASITISPKRFCKFVRPGWNTSLKIAQGNSKAAYRVWCANGRPRNRVNPLFSRYKECKRIFRRELRNYKRCQHDLFYNSLDLNDRNLYHQIRLHHGHSSPSINKLVWKDLSFEGNEISVGWAQYFQSLATPNWESTDFDTDSLLEVELQLSDLIHSSDTVDLDDVITPDQVLHAIQKLSIRKAVGPDHLSAEHFINGPVDALSSLLAPLFSAMIRTHYVPPSFTISHIIPLLKGKSLDPTNPSNYRGISISSTFSKIFEAIVLDLASVSLSQSLHSLQGGFRKGYSTSHTSFIIIIIYLCLRNLYFRTIIIV